jgi:hypothetical protein
MYPVRLIHSPGLGCDNVAGLQVQEILCSLIGLRNLSVPKIREVGGSITVAGQSW